MQKMLELLLILAFDSGVFQPSNIGIFTLLFNNLVESLLVVFLDVVVQKERVSLVVNFDLH